MGGAEVEPPPRWLKPTLEGEEPERDRGGVCTDVMAGGRTAGGVMLRGERREERGERREERGARRFNFCSEL